MHSRSNHYEVVIVGAGHNALVSAAYLAKAGLSVLVLERLKRTGGAAVSAKPFTGQPVRLSRYSYLISLLPQALIADLDLNLDLASRQTASYTPWSRNGEHGGLLVERPEGKKTRKSFRKLTGSDDEYAAWRTFYQEVGELAQLLAPTLMAPLPREQELRSQIEQGVWDDFIANPLGMTLQRRFRDDLVRGVVATDALIGTFASLNDPSLIQNRCFLYHLIGNGTGEWRVPIGGMGALSDALTKAATRGGAEILTNAEVNAIRTGPDGAEVTWSDGSREHSVTASTVLAGVAPWVLTALLGEVSPAQTKPAGSQLKINLLLDRLPRLKSGADPAVAFGGTLHLAEGYTQLQTAYDAAAAGRIPDPMPGEIYCHSLTDDSILRKRAGSAHTLTYFGLHTPAALFVADPAARDIAVERALASIDAVLAEPLAECISRDRDGRPCVEAKTPQDIEQELAMPGGHIFHGDLEWPWAANRARLETPAQQWGVATEHDSVLLCGSGARRGGAVSGLGGHNAAQALLASR